MNLQVTNKRLLEEIKTLSSLLIMKIRVEGGIKDPYDKLQACISRLISIEDKANDQQKHYSELETEVLSLRKTCEKFTELTESVQFLHIKYKQQLSALSTEKSSLLEEINNIRFFLYYHP